MVAFAQHVAAEAELAVHATRAARELATVALTARRGVARQLLQLDHRLGIFSSYEAVCAGDDFLQRVALAAVLDFASFARLSSRLTMEVLAISG